MENKHKQHSFYGDAFLGRTARPYWLLGFVIIFLLYSNVAFPGGQTLWGGVKELLTPGPAIPLINWFERISSSTTFGVFVFPVLLGFLALVLAQRVLRQRPLRPLINGLTNLRWRRMVFAFGVFICIAVLFWGDRWAALSVGASVYAFFLMADIFFSPGLIFDQDVPLAMTLMFLNWFVFGLFLSFLCDHDQGLEAAIGIGVAYAVFQEITYPMLLPMIMSDNYLETFELPMAAYLHTYLYIPAILLLLVWSYGAQRDQLS